MLLQLRWWSSDYLLGLPVQVLRLNKRRMLIVLQRHGHAKPQLNLYLQERKQDVNRISTAFTTQQRTLHYTNLIPQSNAIQDDNRISATSTICNKT